MPQRTVTDERRRTGPKMGLPEGPGRFWAATALLVTHIPQRVCSILAPCLAPKSPRPIAHIISLRPLRQPVSGRFGRSIPEDETGFDKRLKEFAEMTAAYSQGTRKVSSAEGHALT